MRYLPFLLLGGLIWLSPAEARSAGHRIAAAQHSPAQGMVQALDSMSALLNSVYSKAEADAAAQQLLKQYKEFRRLQAAAEELPPMPHKNMQQHLSDMEQAMNGFRMACVRLAQEKCYGSAPLGKAVKKLAQDF